MSPFTILNGGEGVKIYKCPYKQCKYNNEVVEDEAIKYNGRYYHKECLKEQQEKIEIRKLFFENINTLEVPAKLNNAINNIIHKKNVSSEYLLYALKYVIENKSPLNYAGGLYYIIGNKDIQNAYNKEKAKVIADEVKMEIKDTKVEMFNFGDAEKIKIKIKSNNYMKII